MLDFGRELCGNLTVAREREWLVTNGIGGFAMGTVADLLSRRYHGLLIAALRPPLGRTLMLAKLDATVTYNGRYTHLYTNHWADEHIDNSGQQHLERFHLEGTTPVWTYAVQDALIERRIWMQPGANTTYIQYTFVRGSSPSLHLQARALCNYRDYHKTTILNDWEPQHTPLPAGIRLQVDDDAPPLYLFAPNADIEPRQDWYEDFFLSIEDYRGQNDVVEDHIYLATIETTLQPGQSFTIIASTDPNPELDATTAYATRQTYEQNLITQANATTPLEQQLILSADQFIVKRAAPNNPDGHSIIAGYPWFSDWGRDTMIALPGLTLATGRAPLAASILRTFAQFIDQGMIPNRFPDEGETPEYNTVDATLWYFEAIRAYYQATNDLGLIRELFPQLQDIISWHQKGTRYQIHVAPDGLLYAGEDGVQLTWMDAKVKDWVVTPRIGKPIEINALWYNALCIMADFATQLGADPAPYQQQAQRAATSFAQFWDDELGYCYDVIDTPAGTPDDSLRPNQLFAVALPHSPLPPNQQKAVVDTCAQQLLTAHGLRSLAANHPDFNPTYGGDLRTRDGAYHQGTVWGWLIGPFIAAHLRVYNDKKIARTFLRPLTHHLASHGIGSISEIFDATTPYTPRGCPAQAWSVAELLRYWQLTS
ncbi:MAG TPA: amylo-alpha-1,6-glucosidase [Anaerolineae bacterium]|nr:amylo-alpha-1,6-glucosidase [Anaerolineae bacterium]